MAEEWSDMPAPALKHPKRVGATDVHWIRSKGQYDFGHIAVFSQGLPIYITDLERTLIDAIRSPDLSGGIVNVLRAWKRAKESLNLEKLVAYADRMNEGVLRQRVGFLLTSLGLTHSRFVIWKATLSRGGSSKLLASAPYAPRFSEEWNLSLNVSESVLAELEEE